MKLLFVISSSQIGGAEKQFILTAKELSNYHEIRLCILGKNGPFRETYRDLDPQAYISKGYLFSDIITLSKAFIQINPKGLVSWLYRADILSGILGRVFKIEQVIISARNTEWPKANKLKLWVLKLNSNRNASIIVANSERAAQYHKKIGYPESRIMVIRNFIQLASLPIELREPKILGLAARPVPGKGHMEAINALRELRNQGHDLKLSFIGPRISEWQDLELATIDLRDYIQVIDGGLDIRDWFHEIDIFLSLSTSWESDSNTLLEAIMHGIPSVASDLSLIEDIGDSLKLVNAKDTGSIVQAIIEVIDEPIEERLKSRLGLARQLRSLRNPRNLTSEWLRAIEAKL